MRVSAECQLPGDASTAWDRLLVWEEQPAWMVDAASIKVLTPHREGTGVRIVVRTRILGLPLLTDTLEVVVWEPPRRLVMERTGFVRGAGEWRLDPSGDGGTRFRWEERVALPIPLLGELTLLAYRPFMHRLMRRSLGRFAGMLTGRDSRAG